MIDFLSSHSGRYRRRRPAESGISVRLCYPLYCKIHQRHFLNPFLFFFFHKFRFYGAKCSNCVQSISPQELVMRAGSAVYHVQCFVCSLCGYQLQRGQQFVVRQGQLLCRMDYEKEMARLQYELDPWCPNFSPTRDIYGPDDDSSMEENDADANKGPKRPRTILTTSQRRKFKTAFEVNPKPCRKVRTYFSLGSFRKLNCTMHCVRCLYIWR